jgi:hypothetical protein
MPKYRQLHTKIIDSFDFNEMPDDFHRVTWILLTVIVDSAGRGIDNPSWVRSRMYPLREDVSCDQIRAVMDWFESRKMIMRYKIGGKSYFYIPTFKTYQTGTEREAQSVLPAPQYKVQTNSGVIQEEVKSNSLTYASASVNESESVNELEDDETASTPYRSFIRTFVKKTGIPETHMNPQKALDAVNNMIGAGVEVRHMETAIDEMLAKNYNIGGIWSVVNGSIMAKTRTNGKQVDPHAGFKSVDELEIP